MSNKMQPGMFSGNMFIQRDLSQREPVQYGPHPYGAKDVPDPVNDLIDEVTGKHRIPYEPNGAVYRDLSKSEYLKS
jgi:hypothetical protein